ncbi:BLUF domain-containing protein [Chitinibacter sp. S2-10]|uniref:BLUF domain-containing protein n=1 Tax=Chitinibacter sp. S2-10 TaxID=3373597 RepID=UPI0039772ED5
MMMLLAITYVSHSSHLLTEEMRFQLMRECELRNAHQNITGLLLYQQGYFLQYLEGPPDTVRKVFASISKDPRNEEVELMSEEVILKRRFPNWSMFFRDYDFMLPHLQQSAGELLTLARVVEALDEMPQLRQTMFDFLQNTHDQQTPTAASS